MPLKLRLLGVTKRCITQAKFRAMLSVKKQQLYYHRLQARYNDSYFRNTLGAYVCAGTGFSPKFNAINFAYIYAQFNNF